FSGFEIRDVMPGGVVDGLVERLQLLHRVLSHHPPCRRKLGVLDAALFPLPVPEVGLCFGLLLCLDEHSPRSTSFAEADIELQVWSFWILIFPDPNLPPSPQEDGGRVRIFVVHVFVFSFFVCETEQKMSDHLVFVYTYSCRNNVSKLVFTSFYELL